MIIILSLDRNQNMRYIFFTHTVMATERKFKFPIIIIMPENNVVLFHLGHISFPDNLNGFLNELTKPWEVKNCLKIFQTLITFITDQYSNNVNSWLLLL